MYSENVGGIPMVLTKTGSDHDGSHSAWGAGLWIFALVIIFLALVFLWGRRGEGEQRPGGGAEYLPYMAAMGMMQNQNQHRGGHYGYEVYAAENHREHVDEMRDNLREFGNLKKDVNDCGYQLSKQVNDNHYTASRQSDQIQYNITSQNDRNLYLLEKGQDGIKHQNAMDTRLIIDNINCRFFELEKQSWERERLALRDKILERDMVINGDRVIGAVRPRIEPSYPVYAPTPLNFGSPHHGECYGY